MITLAALALLALALIGFETLRPKAAAPTDPDATLNHRADAELARMVEEWKAAKAKQPGASA